MCTHRDRQRVKIWGVHTGSVRGTNIKQGRMVIRLHLFSCVSSDCCCFKTVKSKWMFQVYNGKFALLLLLKESSPAVLYISSSSMRVHSIDKDRETHGEYVIVFIGIWHHVYWNMASCLLEYGIIFIGIWHHVYWNMSSYLLEYVIIFIGICNHIYWNMSSYLLEYVIIFIEICNHIYWNILSYLMEYVIIFIGIYNHIYWNMSHHIYWNMSHHIYWNMSSY